MDLRNNRITIGEILVYPRGRAILERYFPEIMNPFLLVIAERMILSNILKLAQGADAQERIDRVVSGLKAI